MADIKHIVDHTLKWEGGLSNAKTDTASANPSPYVHKGATGWHTNKGITYAVFKSGSQNLGYENNANNFLTMPNDVWMKIAKNLFWDKLHLDEVKSQVVANLLFSWTWASGYGWRNRVQKYFASKGVAWSQSDFKGLPAIVNSLTAKYGEKVIADEMFDQYKQFYLSLGQKSNPKTAKYPDGIYTKGWLNRLADLQTYSYASLGKAISESVTATTKTIKENPITAIIITSVLMVAGYLVYNYGIKKQRK